MTQKFRFDGYNGQGEQDYMSKDFVKGKIYQATDICHYVDSQEPDALFYLDGEWVIENMCFFTEIVSESSWLDTVSEPSPAELAQMNASAEELRLQFE